MNRKAVLFEHRKMCYSLYISTDSTEDLRSRNTDFVTFQKAEDYEFKAPEILKILEFPHKWFVGSKSGCSCTFRHLFSTDLGFGPPEDWYEEEKDAVDATGELYDVLAEILSLGHRIDCIDMWAGADERDIRVLQVSLDSVARDAFRLFENHRFVLHKDAET